MSTSLLFFSFSFLSYSMTRFDVLIEKKKKKNQDNDNNNNNNNNNNKKKIIIEIAHFEYLHLN